MNQKQTIDFLKSRNGFFMFMGFAIGILISFFIVPLLILGSIGLVVWWYYKNKGQLKKDKEKIRKVFEDGGN